MKQERTITGRLVRMGIGQTYADISLIHPTADLTRALPAVNMEVTVTVSWDEPERPLEKGDTVRYKSDSCVIRAKLFVVVSLDGNYAWIKPAEGMDWFPFTTEVKRLERVPE